MRTVFGWRVVTAALLVLAIGCGGDDDGGAPADNTTRGVDEAGEVYVGTLEDDSALRVVLNAPDDHPEVAPFEAFRRATGAPAVTWIVAEVDVPDGTDGTGRFLSFVAEGADPLDDDPLDDTDGITNADFACSRLDEWASSASDPSAVAELHLELYEGPCGGQTLQVLAPGGATTTYVLVYEGELPAFDRILAGLFTDLERA